MKLRDLKERNDSFGILSKFDGKESAQISSYQKIIPLPASADKKSLNIFFADATAIFDI